MTTTTVDAAIVAVTVYPKQARITRRATMSLASGEQQVLVGGLPRALRTDSVRVAGRGPATVLGVDVAPQRSPRTPDPTAADLEQRRDALALILSELDDEATVLQTQEDLIHALSRRSGTELARGLAAGTTEIAQITTATDTIAERLAAVLDARRGLAQRRDTAQRELDEVDRRLNDVWEQRQPDRMAVTVDLDVAEDGEVELELSYLVNKATWESHYDVRLQDDTLTLTWRGLITQDTGEDWPECDLRLSTARPARSVTVPELKPWYLRKVEPVQAMMVAAPTGARPSPGAARSAARDDAVRELAATVEEGETAATYRPARPIAVPADGTTHRTTIATADLPARLDHVTVPLHGPDVYLRATVKNTSEHTLRPGPAAVFHGAEYVGTTQLKSWGPGEEVELALGVDDRIRVERELVRREAGKAMMGGTQRQGAEYTITIGNHGPRPAHLTVLDQIPVSTDGGIVVKDVRADPKPAAQSDMGEVEWKLDLAPGKSARLTLGFRVDIAKGVQLSGWRD